MAGPIRLSFTLTRFQRVLNPPERLLYTVLGIGASLCSLLPLCVAPQSLSCWAISSFLVALSWFVFRGPMRSFFYDLFGEEYVKTLMIENDLVILGVDEPQLSFNRGLAKVEKGLWGTVIVRWVAGCYSITVPQSAISVRELRCIIEGRG